MISQTFATFHFDLPYLAYNVSKPKVFDSAPLEAFIELAIIVIIVKLNNILLQKYNIGFR